MNTWTRRIAALALIVMTVATASWARAQVGGGRAWIDAPLGWQTLTSSPVPVVAHVTDPSTVAEARLDVNGATISVVDTPGNTLEKVEFSWAPPSSGVYLLEVFGRSEDGSWGSPGLVVVSVELGERGEATTTTTTTESPSTTTTIARTTTTSTTTSPSTSTTRPPATTSTTTTTSTTRPPATTSTTTTTTTSTTSTTTTTLPCRLGVPVPTGPAGTVSTTTPLLTWSYTGCEPEEFEIQVSRDPGFVRLEQQGIVDGAARSWTTGPLANCVGYHWRIRTHDLGRFGSWSNTGSFFVQTGRTCP